jgi:ABC-type glycerol-3-phosphate transport system permease component
VLSFRPADLDRDPDYPPAPAVALCTGRSDRAVPDRSQSTGRSIELFRLALPDVPAPARSTRWYQAYFNAIEWREATYVSFAAAILTTLLSTTLGTLAAYGLHALRSRWSALGYGAFTLPLLIPAILIAIGIFLSTRSSGSIAR